MIMVHHHKPGPKCPNLPPCAAAGAQIVTDLMATQHLGLMGGLRQHKGKTGKFLTQLGVSHQEPNNFVPLKFNALH